MALFLKKQQPWLAQAVLDGAERPMSPSQGQLVQVIDVAPDATMLLVSDTRHQVCARLHPDCDARDVRVGLTIVLTSFLVRTSAVVSLTSAPHFYLLVSAFTAPSRTVLSPIGQPAPLTDHPAVSALLQRQLSRCSMLRPDLLERARADALELLESDCEIPPDQRRRLDALPGWTLPPLRPAAATLAAAAAAAAGNAPLAAAPAAAPASADADAAADGSQQPSECSPLAPAFSACHLVLDRGTLGSQPVQSLSPGGGGEAASPQTTTRSRARARGSMPGSARTDTDPRTALRLRAAMTDGADDEPAPRARAPSPLGTRATRSKRLRLGIDAAAPAARPAARAPPGRAPLWLLRQLCVPLAPAPRARAPGSEPAPAAARESAEVVDALAPATRTAIERAAAFTQRIHLSFGRPVRRSAPAAQPAPAAAPAVRATQSLPATQSVHTTQSLPASEPMPRPPLRTIDWPERTSPRLSQHGATSASLDRGDGAESDRPRAASERPCEVTASFAQDDSELLELQGEALRRGIESARKQRNLERRGAADVARTSACPTWLLRELICVPRASLVLHSTLSGARPERRDGSAGGSPHTAN